MKLFDGLHALDISTGITTDRKQANSNRLFKLLLFALLQKCRPTVAFSFLVFGEELNESKHLERQEELQNI